MSGTEMAYGASPADSDAQQRPATDWRPISSAPLDGTVVLLWYPWTPFPEAVIGKFVRVRKTWQWIFKDHEAWGYSVKGAPRYWMPIPSPPIDADASGESQDGTPEADPGITPKPS